MADTILLKTGANEFGRVPTLLALTHKAFHLAESFEYQFERNNKYQVTVAGLAVYGFAKASLLSVWSAAGQLGV